MSDAIEVLREVEGLAIKDLEIVGTNEIALACREALLALEQKEKLIKELTDRIELRQKQLGTNEGCCDYDYETEISIYKEVLKELEEGVEK